MAERLQSVEIQELRFGEDCVRIDWITDPREQTDKRDRPAFQVGLLVSFCDGSHPSRILTDVPQKLIKVSVDALPALWTGSLWRHGRRLRQPGYSNTRSAKIEFVVGDERWLALEGSKVSDKEFDRPIPQSQIPILRKSKEANSPSFWPLIKDSQLLHIKCRNAFPSALVPAIELARFYACTSSVLSRNLFAGGWPGLEYPPNSGDEVIDGVAKIGVDNIKNMDRLSAVSIARYKFSEAMRRQVDRAGQALSYFAARKKPAFRFGFPFDDIGATARIECDVLDFQKRNYLTGAMESFCLVTHIKKCYMRLPFSELEVEFKVDPTQGQVDDASLLAPMSLNNRVKGSQGADSASSGGVKTAPPDPTTVSIAPAIPNAFGEVTPFVDDQSRFATFDYSKVRLVSTKTKQVYRAVRQKTVAGGGPADGVSTNPGKGKDGRSTEAQISAKSAEPLPSLPVTLKQFENALEILRRSPDYTFVINRVRTKLSTTECQHRSGNVYVILLRKLAKSPTRWHRTSVDRDALSASRSRYLLIAHVSFKNGAQYLIGEIERLRKSDQHSIFCAQIYATTAPEVDALIIEIATEVSKRRSWPKLANGNSIYLIGKTTLQARRLTHKGLHSSKEYAQRIAKLESK